jgi:hypothetical protein
MENSPIYQECPIIINAKATETMDHHKSDGRDPVLKFPELNFKYSKKCRIYNGPKRQNNNKDNYFHCFNLLTLIMSKTCQHDCRRCTPIMEYRHFTKAFFAVHYA